MEKLLILASSSEISETTGLIVSARASNSEKALVIVGNPGQPNASKELRIGDAILYQTIDRGLIEIRLMATSPSRINVLITPIHAESGFAAGFIEQSQVNRKFSASEIEEIRDSVALLTEHVKRIALPQEQERLILEKLEEMQSAANRLGRKDWILYTAGTLTSILIATSLDQETAQDFLVAANKAFSWLFSESVQLVTQLAQF